MRGREVVSRRRGTGSMYELSEPASLYAPEGARVSVSKTLHRCLPNSGPSIAVKYILVTP